MLTRHQLDGEKFMGMENQIFTSGYLHHPIESPVKWFSVWLMKINFETLLFLVTKLLQAYQTSGLHRHYILLNIIAT